MEERAIDRLRKFARYARDKGVVKGENSFEAYCELSNRYIYNSIRNGKGVKMENVSKMLGHTNVRTTQQYAKVLNAEVEKDFEMLERILS